MAISVVMPALEMAQETGKLVSWLKNEGDKITKGEPLLEIETDKAVMEIDAPGDGVLTGIKAKAGEEIPVGQTIAWLVGPGEVPPMVETPLTSGRQVTTTSPLPSASTQTVSQPAPARVAISPKARRLAREHGIDLGKVRGTGRGGEILTTDVEALAAGKSASVSPGGEPLSSTAKLMAERTTQSWTSVPHFFAVREVNAAGLLALREKLLPEIEQQRGVRLTHTDLLVALVARVLAKHPRLNASWTDGAISFHPTANIAMAVATEDAVVAPVIHNADTADLAEIAVRRRELAERAKAGRLHSQDIAGATFTISNLGMYHVDAFQAIISPPQAAILAVARITERVVPVDGKPGIRPMMTLTLSSDHRVVDGARAAMFLNDVAEAILAPEKWL